MTEALKLVKLSGYEQRQIEGMSGGQKQRVAIARAIVNEPEILLLDESLSALDLKLRTEMQYELRELQSRLGITFIFVTHDQEEALALSDYIFVMKDGKIQQFRTPIDIYDEPVNRFVADFIGESNIVEGRMVEDFVVNIYGQDFECVDMGIPENKKSKWLYVLKTFHSLIRSKGFSKQEWILCYLEVSITKFVVSIEKVTSG